jgi:hypothetical protein
MSLDTGCSALAVLQLDADGTNIARIKAMKSVLAFISKLR